MSHVLYPTQFPVQCALDVVSLIRSGNYKDHIPEFGLHLWNLQGYAQYAALGLPPNHAFSAGPLASDEQLSELEDNLVAFTEDADRGAFGASAEAIDLATILLLIQVASQVIAFIRTLRKK